MESVLIIEDNNDIRENTAEILELAGYKTFIAANGREGVEIATRELPSIIICDIMMPELDGYGVLHLLRRNASTVSTPFIFLTAKAERSDLRKGMEMGADDYITKPFSDIELLNAVEARLKKAAVLTRSYSSNSSGFTQFLDDLRANNLVSKLSEKYSVEHYPKKQNVYGEGKHPRFLYYLVSGKVKCFRTHEDGKEYITDLFNDGDFIGYSALLEDSTYTESAATLESSEVMQIPKDDFLKMVFGDLAVAGKFIHIMTRNVKEKEERLLSLAYSSLRKRVARSLVDIVDKFHLTDQVIEISREELAQYVGTATESLIRTLSDFKAEGLIEIRQGKILVSSPDRLKAMLY